MGLKKCKFCAEQIQEEAVKCHWCGEFLDPDYVGENVNMGEVAAFLHQKDGQTSELQRELMLRCLHLNNEECAEVLGGLTRMMLEPGAEFWDALHKVFELREANRLMSSMPS